MSAAPDGKLAALVLRATPYRDHDLIVDLFTDRRGRVAAMARGARKSRRRFGGALEIGTRLDVELARGRGNLPTLSSCDVTGPLDAVRGDLDRFHHLAYALELGRLLTTEGEPDRRGFELLCAYIALLEAHPAAAEPLAAWELKMLAHHGYALRLDACVISGGPPDGLSLRHGGAVTRAVARSADALPVPTRVLAQLAALDDGGDARFDPRDHVGIRGLFERLWTEICGKPLRTARFLVDPLLRG